MTDANASHNPSSDTGATPGSSKTTGASAPSGNPETVGGSTHAKDFSKEILGTRATSSAASGAGGTSRPGSTGSAMRGRGGAGSANAIALWVVLLLLILAALAGGYWLNQRFEQALGAQGDQTTRFNAQLTDTRERIDQSDNTTHRLEESISALTGKLADTQNQQQALQQLYQDLARNRDDWVMTDAEQTLSTANQQLQLTGNVQLALYALQSADAQLATTDAPQVLVVRRAVAADIDKLKAAPVVDLPGLALRLDQAISKIDGLPLAGDVPAADAVAASGASGASGAASTDAAAGNAGASLLLTRDYWAGLWQRITHHFGASASRLVQVRRIDRTAADAMLVAPEQAAYLKENVKLRLLSARLSLLSRNEPTMQSDLSAADDALARYFDPSSGALNAVRSTIADVRRQAQQVTVPTLEGSLQALRQNKSRG